MQIERSTSLLQQNKYWVTPLHHNCVVSHFDSEHDKKPLPPIADDHFYNTSNLLDVHVDNDNFYNTSNLLDVHVDNNNFYNTNNLLDVHVDNDNFYNTSNLLDVHVDNDNFNNNLRDVDNDNFNSNFMATREIWDKFPELFYKIA